MRPNRFRVTRPCSTRCLSCGARMSVRLVDLGRTHHLLCDPEVFA